VRTGPKDTKDTKDTSPNAVRTGVKDYVINYEFDR